MQHFKSIVLVILMSFGIMGSVRSQQKPGDVNTSKQNAQALADKLSNPVASMISVPFQNNTALGCFVYLRP